MNIHLATIPDVTRLSAVAAVRKSLPAMRSPGISTAVAADLSLSLEHPLYNLTAADVTTGHGLAAARQTGWRLVVEKGDASVATVEIPSQDASGFAVQEGPFAAGLVAAVALAETVPDNGAQYELRLLRIPALYVEMVWLAGKGTGDDHLIPIAPAPAPLDPQHVYGEADGLATLKMVAQSRDLRTRPTR